MGFLKQSTSPSHFNSLEEGRFMVEHYRKSFVHKLSRGLSYSSQVVESSKNTAGILHPYSL